MPPELEAGLQAIAPGFIKAVKHAMEGDDVSVILTIDAFAGDPELFYACAAYANDRGVALTLAPKTKPERQSELSPTD